MLLALIFAGLALGVALSPLAARLLADYLYEISARDVTTYAITIILALGVCGVASVAASRRLCDADLATVLRSDS